MKDRRAIFRAVRRLSSTRAAAFLEFCMIAPILVMFCSGIFEFVQLWDAKIMANHAAWTVGRIASVQAGLTDSATRLTVTDGMKFATAALMSTATMGIGGNAVKASPGWLSEPLRSDINRLASGLQLSGADGQMTAVVNDFPKDYLVEIFGPIVGKFLSMLFSSSVANIVNGSIEDVKTGLWQPILNTWHPAATMSAILGNCKTHNVENGDRQLRQMGVAQQLVNRTVDGQPVLSVTEGETGVFVLSKDHSLSGNTSVDFPRCLDGASLFDDWRVTQDSSWPPINSAQRMILVAVSWPFERAWLYPIFSRTKWSGKDPVAVGESIAYPQPKIRNVNLQSVGAEAYKRDPVPPIPKEFGDLREQYVNFLKTAAFAITYRLGHEFIGAHDADDLGGSHTHKGLGLMPVKPSQREKIERRFGNHRSPWIWDVSEKCDPIMKSSMARDGLCYWMDRAKLPPPAQNDPWNLKAKRDIVWTAWEVRDGHYADYLWGWRSVAILPHWGTDYDKDVLNGGSERWLFHCLGARQWIFIDINDYARVHANEWFHWGKETGPKLTFVDKKGNKSTGPSERERHQHLRHRKSKSLDDVLSRKYEEPYLGSGYTWYRNLESQYTLDADFNQCQDKVREFFKWFQVKKDRSRIAAWFNDQAEWLNYKVRAEQDHRFYPTIRHFVDGVLTREQQLRFRDQEDWLKRHAKDVIANYEKMINLLEAEQEELERTIFGGAMPTPGSGDDIWKFGIDERDVQKDPQAALKNMEEAIKKKKSESMEILYGISDRIRGLRGDEVHAKINKHLTRWPFDGADDPWGTRKRILIDFLGNLVKSWRQSPGFTWEQHMERLRGWYQDKEQICEKLRASANEMSWAMSHFCNRICDLYNQELEYGLKLGLNAAKEAKRRDEKKKKIEPVKPGDWPPAPPKPPSRDPGSDDDTLGDGWRLEGSDERRGWKSFTDGGWKP